MSTFKPKLARQIDPTGLNGLITTDGNAISSLSGGDVGDVVRRAVGGGFELGPPPPASADWGDIGGTLGDQTDLSSALAGKANTSHTHAATDITSGTLPVNRGGTGGSNASAARANLGAASENDLYQLRRVVWSSIANSSSEGMISWSGALTGAGTAFSVSNNPLVILPQETGYYLIMCTVRQSISVGGILRLAVTNKIGDFWGVDAEVRVRPSVSGITTITLALVRNMSTTEQINAGIGFDLSFATSGSFNSSTRNGFGAVIKIS